MTTAHVSEAGQEIDKLLALHPKGFDLSLDRITRLLDTLGNPQDRLPPIIHVAGTTARAPSPPFRGPSSKPPVTASMSIPRRTSSTGTNATGSEKKGGAARWSVTPSSRMRSAAWRWRTTGRRSPSSRS